MKQPLITVLIPAYNAGKYIEESIQSILNQSYSNLEIIVIDDGSTDSTYSILKDIQDKRIRLYRNSKNCGVAYTLNRGLGLARGKYIARHDADDLSVHDRIAAQAQYLDNHPIAQVVSSDYIEFDASNQSYKSMQVPELLTFISCPVHHPGTMYRRDFILKNRCFYEGEAEDFFFWNQIYKANGYRKGTFHNFNQAMFYYRIHNKQLTSKKSEVFLIEKNKAFANHFNDFLKYFEFGYDVSRPLTSAEISAFKDKFEKWEKPIYSTEAYDQLKTIFLYNFYFYNFSKSNLLNDLIGFVNSDQRTLRSCVKFVVSYNSV